MIRIPIETRTVVPAVASFLLVLGVWAAFAQSKVTPVAFRTHPELGKVTFLRDYATAISKAKADGKPLFVLFDEVPGCATCRGFGSGPLSHPIVVSAAESEFVPLAVFNNLPGRDADVLKAFNEPTWNNPVIRFLGSDATDLIPRKDGDYSTEFVLTRMAASLAKAKKPVPEYLRLAIAEYGAEKTETAAFAMYCYWEGEAKLGALEGVVGTKIGELQGSEVVEVTFDPSVIAYKALVEQAAKMDCTHRVFARSAAQLKVAKEVVGDKAILSARAVDARTQQQYHLAYYPSYHYLPLTAIQATRANSMLASRQWPDRILLPGQLELKKKLDAATDAQKAAMKKLTPDRSPEGLTQYDTALRTMLEGGK